MHFMYVVLVIHKMIHGLFSFRFRRSVIVLECSDASEECPGMILVSHTKKTGLKEAAQFLGKREKETTNWNSKLFLFY